MIVNPHRSSYYKSFCRKLCFVSLALKHMLYYAFSTLASSCLCKLQKLSTLSVVSVCETNNLHETDCVLLFSDFFFIVAW